jgi:citrate lyase subunit beta/citryl-CoA lyase
MTANTARRRRSVLYVPASNEKALARAAGLDADVLVFDLEDAVAPDAKSAARERLRTFFAASPAGGPERVIRINPLASDWGGEDLLAARACKPDVILVPKVNVPRDVLDVRDALGETDAPDTLQIWAMAETPRFLLNIREIAEVGLNPSSRLSCFVAGTNDLAKETGVATGGGRRWLGPWLMQIVLAGRAAGLDVIDGVYNDFRDAAGFGAECAEGRAMGFDGKSLIHPDQIAPCNAAFSPTEQEIAAAKDVVAAFAAPGNGGKSVVALSGRMVERLHLVMAERVLARAGAV